MNSTLLNVPVGAIIDYAGNDIPSGYLECDGSSVLRSEYPKLFVAIGTAWGAGDGSTTFNLPNLSDRVTLGRSSSKDLASTGGEEKHTLTIDEMPKHDHTFKKNESRNANSTATSGSTFEMFFMATGNLTWYALPSAKNNTDTGLGTRGIGQGYSTITNTGGVAHSIMQPYATVRKLIRAA